MTQAIKVAIVYWWQDDDEVDFFGGGVDFGGAKGISFSAQGEMIHGKLTTAEEFHASMIGKKGISGLTLLRL